MSAAPEIANISCYKFAPLEDLKALRAELIALSQELGLKGTILLSQEGINLFVAGPRDSVDALVVRIRAVPGLEDLAPKYSPSTEQPFRRMLVRIKKEIIAFGVEGVNPGIRTSPKLKATELKQWLDEGRPVTLLDTRNDYEVKLGTFRNALPIGIDHFRDFPAAVRQLPAHLKQQPIVMFCTGGIRCEKAGPFMEMEGFEHIHQLDGGILKYFEEVGGSHYDGECFVFDQRVGLDPSLHETGSTQCFACLSPLTAAEQQDARYQINVSCPYCYKTSEQQRALSIRQRQEALSRVAHPLPGSLPYDNDRPLTVPLECERWTLLDFLCRVLPQIPREQWETECEAGLLIGQKGQSLPANTEVRAGDRILHRHPAITEPDVSADIRILHEDEALLVVAKPAPLPMHPCGRFHRNTLQWLLNEAFHPEKPRPAHRLDADTTGVVVFTRSAHFAKLLAPQFRTGQVQKTYLLRCQGHPAQDDFTCSAPIGEDDLRARHVDEQNGSDALTHFRVLKRHADGTSLLEARPQTGRTNQIRIHAGHCGHPIVGDTLHEPGTATTRAMGDPPLCLHASSIVLRHPLTGEKMEFQAAAPEWV